MAHAGHRRVGALLSTALGIDLEPHDSLYLGDYYLWPPSRQLEARPGKLYLLPNFFDDIDQELAYPEHPDHGVAPACEQRPGRLDRADPRPARDGGPREPLTPV